MSQASSSILNTIVVKNPSFIYFTFSQNSHFVQVIHFSWDISERSRYKIIHLHRKVESQEDHILLTNSNLSLLAGLGLTPSYLSHGVRQGSVLGPLLFIKYMVPLGMSITCHLHLHCYTDNMQIYIYAKLSDRLPPAWLI